MCKVCRVVGMAKYRRKEDGAVVNVIQFDGTLEGAAEVAGMFSPVEFEDWDNELLYLSLNGEPLNEAIPLKEGQYVVTRRTSQGVSGGAMDSEAFLEKYEPITKGDMSTDDQVEAFSKEIWKVIDRFINEFDLPLSGALGVLEIAKFTLLNGGKDS